MQSDLCTNCGCSVRNYPDPDATFGGGEKRSSHFVAYAHSKESHCIHALKRRVRDLERAVSNEVLARLGEVDEAEELEP